MQQFLGYAQGTVVQPSIPPFQAICNSSPTNRHILLIHFSYTLLPLKWLIMCKVGH